MGQPKGASVATTRAKVLVVDDDAAMRAAFGKVLRRHEVTLVGDAPTALARLVAGHRYDAIVCDLTMPGMSGMELHAELARTIPDQADRMIFVTGGAFTPAAVAFLERVPNPRLDKPFEIADLIAAVERFAVVESGVTRVVGPSRDDGA